MSLLLSAVLGGIIAVVLSKLLGGQGKTGTPPPAPPSAPLPQTRYTTVYLFPTGDGGVRANAAPEILFVRPGDQVEWTVVDATGAGTRQVSFQIKKGRDPFEGKLPPFPREFRARIRPDAVFTEPVRYSILVDGESVFDPEIQMEQ
ncbi:MAG: hypothetical protein R2745_00520 [Vicinamibacterales bacterium]